MAEVLAAAALGIAALTLALAVVIFVRLGRLGGREDLTREAVAQLLRAEADLIRRHGDDQARGLRQELGDSLKNFQDTTTNAFS
ncbi:MAG TPA: hypothetical protein VM434_05205, partial [Beijerinckiaceae bacterium]|nr:hypothetical protein [Beijerinckiaceae bacterium]